MNKAVQFLSFTMSLIIVANDNNDIILNFVLNFMLFTILVVTSVM